MIFRSFKVCSYVKERLGCRKQREATEPIESPVKLQPWFLSLRWKTCLWQNCSLRSCACSEGPALGQNTLMIYTQGVKNNVYNVSGMIEEVKTNMFFIWQNFGLCTVLPLDGLKCRCLDFRHNSHKLVLFVLLCLQQVERVITVSTKTCYDKYTSTFAFTIHCRATAYLQC